VIFESGPCTMTAMARELGMPVTTAADYVRAMTGRGHVRREAHPTDNRSYLLALTAKGKRVHRTASARFQQAHAALLQELPPLREEAARRTLQQLSASAARAIAVLQASTPADQPAAAGTISGRVRNT
jgi:DNA-binding MarR family transcriptional regulator